MIRQITFLIAFFYGLVFESFGSVGGGFYILPALFTVAIFNSLVLTWQSINFVVAWLSGVLFLSLWGAALNHWHFFSYKFAVHILIYFFILLVILCIFDDKETKS